MSPEYVRSYLKAQKNDDRDAEAIAGSGDPADDALRHAQKARISSTCRRCTACATVSLRNVPR